MTLDEIRDTLAAIVPAIRHHRSEAVTAGYAYWDETRMLPFMADNAHQASWAFVAHIYSAQETDPDAAAMFAALTADPRIAFSYQTDYDRDTRLVHHIFDCEGY